MAIDFVQQPSCIMSYAWDYRSGFRGDTELYRLLRAYIPENVEDPFDYGYDIIKTKNRIRGRGTALNIKLTCPFRKATKISGLAVEYIGAD